MWNKIKDHIVFGLIGLIFTIIGGIFLFHYSDIMEHRRSNGDRNANGSTQPNGEPKLNRDYIELDTTNVNKECIMKKGIDGTWILMRKAGNVWLPCDDMSKSIRGK